MAVERNIRNIFLDRCFHAGFKAEEPSVFRRHLDFPHLDGFTEPYNAQSVLGSRPKAAFLMAAPDERAKWRALSYEKPPSSFWSVYFGAIKRQQIYP